jgi:AcrR family transcriptional regulator
MSLDFDADADEARSVPVHRPETGVPVRAKRGSSRSKRSKSEVTRARLCWATSQLIEQKPFRAIKVSDITNLALVSPSTFYIYFADVDEAVLALLDQVHAGMPNLGALCRSITRERLESDVRAFATVYLAFWDAHCAILRIRNISADDGEERFRAARARMLNPMLEALADKIAEFRGPEAGKRRLPPPLAIAAVMSGSLERLAVFSRLGAPRPELERRWLFDAEIFLICQVFLGCIAADQGMP